MLCFVLFLKQSKNSFKFCLIDNQKIQKKKFFLSKSTFLFFTKKKTNKLTIKLGERNKKKSLLYQSVP